MDKENSSNCGYWPVGETTTERINREMVEDGYEREGWWESHESMMEALSDTGGFDGMLAADPVEVWKGSAHYKTSGVEPIQLYKSGKMFRSFALCNIIKYAFRQKGGLNNLDLKKIIHYAELLMEDCG